MATGTEPPDTDHHPKGGGVRTPTRAAIDAPHLRTDRWWLAPAATAAGLLAFIAYSTWRAFANADYYSAPYVSPFYSPCLADNCAPMRHGPNADLFGSWWGISPAIIILIFPLGFRLTCYYYRKAYYRGFWASPPACAVAEPHKKYTGETRFPLVLQNIHRYFFYAALLVACVLTYDTVLSFRDEHYEWGHMGLGTLVFLLNITLIWAYTLSCHSSPAHRRRQAQALLQASRAVPRLAVGRKAERPSYAARLGVVGERRARRLLRVPGRLRRFRRSEVVLMSVVDRQEWDVVVVGAGGAGLRAAIEARERGARTAVICKSLFGKAHTVMAEGGIAAAMANVNEHDNWQVHFRDTMRGGKFLNQWRMAELHAQEAPDRVWELETWGALFDRTRDGRISQRNFGGHEYPRLAHVGDRTGLELIRTLQQKIVSLQQQDKKETGDYESRLKVFQECTVTRVMKNTASNSGSAAGRVSGVFAYERESGRFFVLEAPSVVIATGGIGKSFKVTSNSWEYTGDGHALALLAGAPLLNMEFVQFHPTGMVWPPSVKGILVTESVRGDGGVLRNSEGKRFMFDYIPDVFKEKYAQSEAEGDRWYEDPDHNRRPPNCSPGTRWPAPSTPR